MSLAPIISLEFSRSNARGRSDLHSSKDLWTSQTHIGPGILSESVQDRRGMNAASSPFRQNGVARLAATDRSRLRQQIDGTGWPLGCGMAHRHPTFARIARVLPGPGDRQAPIIRPGAPKRSDSEASSEAAGRRETDAAGGLMAGHGDAGPSSLHAGSASDWAARATAVGAADAARLNPREHCAPQARKGRSISRQAGSVLEVDRGICQVASGRPLLRPVGQAGLD
jgi:hypothetical protein